MRTCRVFACCFALLLLVGGIQAAVIDVSQPVPMTDNASYDRNPSVVSHDGIFWLFYTRGDDISTDGVRGGGYNPDGDSYVVYYKTASTLADLGAAAEYTLALSETARPAAFTQRVVSAVSFGGALYAFVSSGQDGINRGLYYYKFDGSVWSGPVELIPDGTARGGHVNVAADANRVYIVWESSDGSSDCYTWNGTVLNSKIDISNGNQPKLTVFTGSKDLAVLYVVNIEDGTGDIEVFQAAADPQPAFGSHSTAISGGRFYDPCIFNDGINLYVVSAPYVPADRQYLVQTKSVGTSAVWATARTICYGGHSAVEWWDYWPCGLYANGQVWVFFTTETDNGPFFSDGEIAAITMDWDLSHDHYFYVKNAAALAATADEVHIANGTYTESAIAVTNGITIQGASRSGVVLAPAVEGDWCFRYQADNTTITTLTIDGAANPDLSAGNHFLAGVSPGSGVVADTIHVENVTVRNVYYYAISLGNPSKPNAEGLLIADCLVENVEAYHGVRFKYGNGEIHGNTVEAGPYYGIDNEYGHAEVYDNTVSGGYVSIVTFTDYTNTDYDKGYLHATGNIVTDANYGIVVQGDGVVTDNDVTVTVDGGIGIWSASDLYTVGDVNDIVFAGNTIDLECTDGLGFNMCNTQAGSMLGGPGSADRNTVSAPAAKGDSGARALFSRIGQPETRLPESAKDTKGSGSIGILVWWCQENHPLTIQNNLISCEGNNTAVWLYRNPATAAPIVLGNELVATASVSTDPSEGAGVFVTDDGSYVGEGGGDSHADIRQNIITGFVNGVSAFRNHGDNVEATVFNNNLDGYTGLAVNNQTGFDLDASGNWWGSPDASGVAAAVSDSVDYTPWLDTDTEDAATGSEPGFQGDFSVLWVDDDSPQTGTSTRIQEGVDLVTGSIVNVLDGTYGADPATGAGVHITTDGITLLGQSQAGTIIDGTVGGVGASGAFWPKGIHVQAEQVTIRNLTIKDFTGDLVATGGYGIVHRDYTHDDPGEGYVFYDGCTVDQVAVQDCYSAIYALCFTNLTVSGCDLDDNLSDGMFIARGSDGAVIHDNSVVNSGDHGIWVGYSWTAVLPSDNAQIYNNDINGAEEGGISFVASDNAAIYGNTITNAAGAGWSVGALNLKDGPTNVNAHDNTIINNSGTWNGYSGTGHGVGVDGAASGITLYHNTIYGNSGYGVYNSSGKGSDGFWGDRLVEDGISPAPPVLPARDGKAMVMAEQNFWNVYTCNEVAAQVSGDVDFDPWCNADFSYCSFSCDVVEVWVDDDWTGSSPGDNVGTDLYYGYNAFARIQEAIDSVVTGGTVHILNGSYTEQVHIAKADLTVIGEDVDGVVVISPSALTASFPSGSYTNYPVVFIDGVDADISGLTVDGDNQGEANYRFVGIGCYNGGGTLTDIKILRIMNSTFSGQQHGVGVYTFNDTGGPYHIIMSEVLVDDFQKTAIALNGSGLTVDLDNITTTGEGSTGITAQNGIQIGTGVSGTADNCIISLVDYTGETWTATGLLVFGALNATGIAIDQCQTSVFVQDGGAVFADGSISNPIGDAFISYSTGAKAFNVDLPLRYRPQPLDEQPAAPGKAPVAVTISGCTITGTGAAESYGVYAYASGPVTYTVVNNFFSGFAYPISTWEIGGTVTAAIHTNSITGCDYGMATNAAAVQDAGGNWYGTTVPADVALMIDGNVDYSPWLADGTDSDPATPGFQSDFSGLWVDDDSPQSGTTLHIQEGIATIADGKTVTVAEGIYDENVVITHPLILLGDDGAKGPAEINPGGGVGVDIQSSDVTVQHLTIHNCASGIQAYFTPAEYQIAFGYQNIHLLDNEISGIVNGAWGFAIALGTESERYNPDDPLGIYDPALTDLLDFSGLVISGNTIQNTSGASMLIQSLRAYDMTALEISGNIVQYSDMSAIWIDGARDLDLDGNELSSNSNGIFLSNYGDGYYEGIEANAYDPRNIAITDNTISGNSSVGIALYDGYPAEIAIDHNTITGNGTAVMNYLPSAADAEQNYWGAITCDAVTAMVSGNVDFDPWCNADFSYCGFTCAVPEVWVDDDWTGSMVGQDLGGGMYFGYNAFAVIQNGVLGVDDFGIVHVYPGTYKEQVAINHSVTLDGISQPVLRPPTGTLATYTIEESGAVFEPLFFAFGGIDDGSGNITGTGTIEVTISGFVIEGDNMGSSNRYIGILARNCLASEISSNVVLEMLYYTGLPQTFGIMVYGNSNVVIDNNTVNDWTRGGIGANGDDGPLTDPTVAITNNTVVGEGPLGAGNWAQNGIQIGYGASGSIIGNAVSNIKYIPTDWSASGLMLYYPAGGVTVSGNIVHDVEGALNAYYCDDLQFVDGNTFTDNDYVLILGGSDAVISNNMFTGNEQGLYIADATGTSVNGNTFTDNDYAILVDGSAADLTFTGNVISASTECAVYVDEYDGYEPTNVVINGNDISGNAYGVYNLIAEMVNAMGNWWGDVSGPTLGTKSTPPSIPSSPQMADMFDRGTAVPSRQPIGSIGAGLSPAKSVDETRGIGDAVSDNVDYSPWWGANYVTDTHVSPWQWYLDYSNNSAIQEGVDMAADGDFITVLDGAYQIPVSIDGRANLTILGESRHGTIFYPATTLGWNVASYGSSRTTAVRVVNSTGITFSNMSFNFNLVKGNNVSGILYWSSDGEISHNNLTNMNVPDGDGGYYELTCYLRAPGPDYSDDDRAHIDILDNIFMETGRLGVVTHDYVDVLIEGNTFDKVDDDFGYALEIGSMSTGIIRGNEFRNYDTWAASDRSGSGAIYIENAYTAGVPPCIKTVLVEDNDITACQTGIIVGNEFLGYAGDVDIAATITGNTIHDNATTGSESSGGILLVDADKASGSSMQAVLDDNVIENNGDYGLYMYIPTGAAGDLHLTMTNNTIIDNNVGMTVKDYGQIGASSFDLLIHRNLFDNTLNAEDDAAGGYWDDGISAGNCWSDFTGGPGDPYPVPGNAGAIDRYPNVDCGNTCDCVPGDANNDTAFNLLDILYLISYLYGDPLGPEPIPYDTCSGDANIDCTVNLLDILYLIDYKYGTPLGPAPGNCIAWTTNCGLPVRMIIETVTTNEETVATSVSPQNDVTVPPAQSHR
ncbi:MAG: right-handed parallel beta-helix repeat-containing protein [candidate division Zixibacteria bacterium]|nr:right-handed parallel beta-helix repeat-containing protein [candidate division Zixibacteria bacterium]